MKTVFLVAILPAASLVMAACESADPRTPHRWGALDPQTVASITQGPDMITPAGSSQKAARAELEAHHPYLARTVTAMRWHELRDR